MGNGLASRSAKKSGVLKSGHALIFPGSAASHRIGQVPSAYGGSMPLPIDRPGTGRGLGAPAEFRDALSAIQRAHFRPEVFVEEMPAPQRIAPHATALSADLTVDDEDIATGRLVLLHDPAGNDTWQGTFRCVAYVRAEIDPEQGSDPLLAEVAWTWLEEALAANGADYLAISGTVTCVTSETFGSMSPEPASAQIEIRASWTPTSDVQAHTEAWGELLCTAAGLPPVPEGVATIPSRRGQRGE